MALDRELLPASEYKLIFEDNRTGALILAELVARFSRKATTTGGIDAILETYKNAGQWEVVNFIVGRCNRANQPTDQPDNPEVTT